MIDTPQQQLTRRSAAQCARRTWSNTPRSDSVLGPHCRDRRWAGGVARHPRQSGPPGHPLSQGADQRHAARDPQVRAAGRRRADRVHHPGDRCRKALTGLPTPRAVLGPGFAEALWEEAAFRAVRSAEGGRPSPPADQRRARRRACARNPRLRTCSPRPANSRLTSEPGSARPMAATKSPASQLEDRIVASDP